MRQTLRRQDHDQRAEPRAKPVALPPEHRRPVRYRTQDLAVSLSASPAAMARLDQAFVQLRQAVAGAHARLDDPHGVAASGFAGGGAGLPYGDVIDKSFGRHDLSGVRAYVGGAASAACDALGARAYASGGSVAFAQAPDLHTAAHEAAHVVQQRGGAQLRGGVGEAGDAYERHADAVADRVVAGRSAEALLDRPPSGGAGGVRALQLEESGASEAEWAPELGEIIESHEGMMTPAEWAEIVEIAAGGTPEDNLAAAVRVIEVLRPRMHHKVGGTTSGRVVDHDHGISVQSECDQTSEYIVSALQALGMRAEVVIETSLKMFSTTWVAGHSYVVFNDGSTDWALVHGDDMYSSGVASKQAQELLVSPADVEDYWRRKAELCLPVIEAEAEKLSGDAGSMEQATAYQEALSWAADAPPVSFPFKVDDHPSGWEVVFGDLPMVEIVRAAPLQAVAHAQRAGTLSAFLTGGAEVSHSKLPALLMEINASYFREEFREKADEELAQRQVRRDFLLDGFAMPYEGDVAGAAAICANLLVRWYAEFEADAQIQTLLPTHPALANE